jgi:voltage-gated potassium channel
MFFYHWVEGWRHLDSLCFCMVSRGTVGYGDITPTTPVAKIFTMISLLTVLSSSWLSSTGTALFALNS